MDRRSFLAASASAGLAMVLGAPGLASEPGVGRLATKAPSPRRPRAITMWEFSWIERRWPGAGYEDWDRALDELHLRGYDAVRIDPFPHLLAEDPHRTWTLLPEWNVQDWGSPDVNRIVLMPALTEFLTKCRARGIQVGLSTWYRQDRDNTRLRITSPEIQAQQWLRTLDIVRDAGLIDSILYVDLCNEWPGQDWAPFAPEHLRYGQWDRPASLAWMRRALAVVRERYPQLPLLFSFAGDPAQSKQDLSDFGLLDIHTWMTQQNNGEFYKLVGYNYERFDPKGYTNLSLHADDTYRARPQYWQQLLMKEIDRLAAFSRERKIPLITTECWAIVDYKDWPLLKWDWVKDLCAMAVERASASGQWLAMATSNFCGPQFVGMWRDVAWHQRLTQIIKGAAIAEPLRHGRLYDRL